MSPGTCWGGVFGEWRVGVGSRAVPGAGLSGVVVRPASGVLSAGLPLWPACRMGMDSCPAAWSRRAERRDAAAVSEEQRRTRSCNAECRARRVGVWYGRQWPAATRRTSAGDFPGRRSPTSPPCRRHGLGRAVEKLAVGSRVGVDLWKLQVSTGQRKRTAQGFAMSASFGVRAKGEGRCLPYWLVGGFCRERGGASRRGGGGGVRAAARWVARDRWGRGGVGGDRGMMRMWIDYVAGRRR